MSSDRFNEEHPCPFYDASLRISDDMRAHLRICGSKTDQCLMSQTVITNSRKFEPFFEKQAYMCESLGGFCYQTEIDHVIEKLQFNIIIMGSPRVAKSELINALCDGNQAETSPSLDSCTQKITCYTLEDNRQRNPNIKPFKINFDDTPGIESRENKAGEMTMTQFIEKTNPVCMICCASPGSYANLNQLHSIPETCQT